MLVNRKSLAVVSAVAVAAFAAGCEWKVNGVFSSDGQVQLSHTIDAKAAKKRVKKGLPLTFAVPAGRLSSQVQVENSEIDLLIYAGGKDPLKAEFDVPKGVKLPKDGGQLFLSAAQTRQPYDLLADVVVTYDRSRQERGYESCSSLEYYEDCNCSAAGEVICQRRSASIPGDKEVEYYYLYTHRDIKVDLLYPNSRQSVAQFAGVRDETDKVYTYQGMCRPDMNQLRQIRRRERHEVRNCRPPVVRPPVVEPPRNDRPGRPDRPSRPGRPGRGDRDPR